MPILKSAKKALRQDKKRRLLNLRRIWAMRRAIKTVRQAVGSMSKEELKQLLNAAYKALDKGARTGIIKKNTAARKKSRLAKLILRTPETINSPKSPEDSTPPLPPKDQKPPQAQSAQS